MTKPRETNTSGLRLGSQPWVLDLLVFTAALCGFVSLFFLPDAIDAQMPNRDGAMLITVSSAIVGVIVPLALPAILRPGPSSRTVIRAIAVLLCLTVILAPAGVAMLWGLARSQPGVWQYGPVPRWVTLLLLVPALAWAGLDLGVAEAGSWTIVPAISLLTATTLIGAAGVLLRSGWARPIAGVAALLTAVTGIGLPLAVPALVMLWRGASRASLEVPNITNLPEPPPTTKPYRPSSLFTVVTALACIVVYLSELPGASLSYAVLGEGNAPITVTLGAVNGPAMAHGEVWRILTAGYLHAGVPHLLLNLLALLVAGTYVERRYGRARTAIVYFGSMATGNILAAVLSDPSSYTLGASGAIMGLFGAMVVVGARFRSERDSLLRSASVVLATLLYGFLHTGVSNAAHIGGLVAGVWLATLAGADPVWTAFVRRREWSRLVVSERDRREAMRHETPPAALVDPSNQLVLRMSTSQRWRWWALASVFPLLLLGDLFYLESNRRSPTGAELAFAALCLLMALASIAIVRQTFGRLELTPTGFREIGLRRSPLVRWVDVEAFFPTTLYYTKYVGYHLTPAAQVGGSILAAVQRQVMRYGMPAVEQAGLMEVWRQRWTHGATRTQPYP